MVPSPYADLTPQLALNVEGCIRRPIAIRQAFSAPPDVRQVLDDTTTANQRLRSPLYWDIVVAADLCHLIVQNIGV